MKELRLWFNKRIDMNMKCDIITRRVSIGLKNLGVNVRYAIIRLQ